ncbi:MAG: tetratricopeptide repeat protein [Acidobacteriaceae bacterium]
MRSLRPALALAFFVSIAAFAKEKPRITIQVVNSEATQRQYTYTTPGRKGTAQTNCTTNGTTNGTINDYGVGPIQTNSTGNANTNCTTTTTAATPPQTYVRSIAQEHVSAILPDGRQVTLWCQQGYRRCDDLQPGSYEAEVDGNSLFVFVHELSGKERKIKYRAVSVEEASVTAPPQRVSDASLPQQPDSAITSQAQNTETPKEQSAGDSPETQFDLGAMYETGKGVPQDYAQAVLWYRKAAEQGYAKAEYRLGVLYANGVGMHQDKTQVAVLFLSAAKQGYAPAYAMIGGAYLTGDGEPIDYAEASFWFSVATVTESQPTLAKADAMQLRVAGLHLSQADLSRVAERARAWLEEHPAKRN